MERFIKGIRLGGLVTRGELIPIEAALPNLCGALNFCQSYKTERLRAITILFFMMCLGGNGLLLWGAFNTKYCILEPSFLF